MTISSFPLVSVVITGFKRPDHLRQTIESLRHGTEYEPIEFILADDCSPPQQQAEMRTMPFDQFVFASRNRGLGANTNAGLDAARGEYVLQLQDDWRFHGPPDFLLRGVRLIQERPSVGIVRFTRTFHRDSSRLPPALPVDLGPDERVFKPERNSPFYLYSDHPHLKSKAFMEFIGRYKESRNMQTTEVDMLRRFNSQTRFEVAYIEGCDCFEHIGADMSHNVPRLSARIGEKMDAAPGLRFLSGAFRALRRRLGR